MSSLEKRKEGMGPGEYEQKAVEAGFVRVCGCDEAGAGPLAGPVYAAAVILAQGADIPGLNDSKKLTEKKREALFPLIQQSALAWSVAGWRLRRSTGPISSARGSGPCSWP